MSARGAGARASGASPAFLVDEGDAPRAQSLAPAASTTSLDSILALQAVDDPLVRRKKLVRRGAALLDTLEALRTDLLIGRIGEGRLNQLLALVTQAREQSDPALDALIDDIELRARVELAKRGHFASL